MRVNGRLGVTGTRKKTYVVTQEEIARRIKGENMSANVFRSLLGVGLNEFNLAAIHICESLNTVLFFCRIGF